MNEKWNLMTLIVKIRRFFPVFFIKISIEKKNRGIIVSEVGRPEPASKNVDICVQLHSVTAFITASFTSNSNRWIFKHFISSFFLQFKPRKYLQKFIQIISVNFIPLPGKKQNKLFETKQIFNSVFVHFCVTQQYNWCLAVEINTQTNDRYKLHTSTNTLKRFQFQISSSEL